MGICPICNGAGIIVTEQTDTVDLCPTYDYRKWVMTINSTVENPKGYVQTLSLWDTYSKLRQAKEVIINTATDSIVQAVFEREGEPQPCGFNADDFVVVMWKRIRNING